MSRKKEDPCDRYWAQLMGQANVSLSGASDIAMKVQLFDVLQRFFDESNCWTEVIRFSVIPETLDYPLRPMKGGRIHRLLAVLDQLMVPQAAMMPEIGTIQFLYPYTNVQPMAAIVIKTVTDPLQCYPPEGVPDWLLPTHYLTLLSGLLGNMMLQPGNSYSNPQLSSYHTQKFRDGIAHARVAATKLNTVGVQNWAFPGTARMIGSQKSGISTFNVIPTPR
jgi:hypothetical protein